MLLILDSWGRHGTLHLKDKNERLAMRCFATHAALKLICKNCPIDVYTRNILDLFRRPRIVPSFVPMHTSVNARRTWRQIMAAAQLSLPKQWEDWCNWLLGIWLCISPWALRFDLEPTATRTAVISGILIILAEVVSLSIFRVWEEWITVILGAWLIICPWTLGISSSVARVNLSVVGLLVMALAFYEVWEARRQSSDQT